MSLHQFTVPGGLINYLNGSYINKQLAAYNSILFLLR